MDWVGAWTVDCDLWTVDRGELREEGESGGRGTRVNVNMNTKGSAQKLR